MKQLTLLYCLLFSVLFHSLNNICIDKNIIVEEKILSSDWSSFTYPTEHYYSQDGFLADTFIQIPFGYIPISTLTQGNIIVDCEGKEKKIIAITKHYVNRYIKLVIDNTSIYTGYDQQYYATHLDKWIAAHRIKKEDLLLNDTNNPYTVTSIELINENALLYDLTIEDHIFCIAPHNICVHNIEPLICGVSSICLGHIVIINPIITTVGAAIALSVIAHKAYHSCIQGCLENTQKNPLPTQTILAERSYYIERSIALETVKKELTHIKNSLESLKSLCDIGSSTTFTYQFLKQTTSSNNNHSNQFLQISAAQEMQLPDNQKANLRALREIKLEQLEKEIIILQATLALHINQLIEHIFNADNEYKNTKKEIESVTALWNNNRDRMTDPIALQSYKANLLEEHLLNSLNQKVTELKIVAHYYNNCVNSLCVQKSTTILDLLEKIDSAITEYSQCIEQEKTRVTHNIFASESYFIHRSISIESIKNETKNYLEKGKNTRNAQAIAKAKNKLENIIAAGSPQNNNNNDDDDKEYPFGKYEDAPYHTKINNSVKSKAPSNGQRALDNSISIGKNTSRRIGISAGEIVILDQTAPGLFHGHVRAWSDLTQVMKNVLTEANLVTSRGKIK